MCKIKNPRFFKRILLSLFLWTLFWVLCLFASSISDITILNYLNPVFWLILINRILIWFFVSVIWIYEEHPVFWFRFPPYIRWTLVWFIVSTQLAIWFLVTNPWNWSTFWWILIIWGIYWCVIDCVVTKSFWEWDKLYK